VGSRRVTCRATWSAKAEPTHPLREATKAARRMSSRRPGCSNPNRSPPARSWPQRLLYEESDATSLAGTVASGEMGVRCGLWSPSRDREEAIRLWLTRPPTRDAPVIPASAERTAPAPRHPYAAMSVRTADVLECDAGIDAGPLEARLTMGPARDPPPLPVSPGLASICSGSGAHLLPPRSRCRSRLGWSAYPSDTPEPRIAVIRAVSPRGPDGWTPRRCTGIGASGQVMT